MMFRLYPYLAALVLVLCVIAWEMGEWVMQWIM